MSRWSVRAVSRTFQDRCVRGVVGNAAAQKDGRQDDGGEQRSRAALNFNVPSSMVLLAPTVGPTSSGRTPQGSATLPSSLSQFGSSSLKVEKYFPSPAKCPNSGHYLRGRSGFRPALAVRSGFGALRAPRRTARSGRTAPVPASRQNRRHAWCTILCRFSALKRASASSQQRACRSIV